MRGSGDPPRPVCFCCAGGTRTRIPPLRPRGALPVELTTHREPPDGIEPSAFRLPCGRSTTELRRRGALGGSRTRTPSRAPGFEPGSSASSVTSAWFTGSARLWRTRRPLAGAGSASWAAPVDRRRRRGSYRPPTAPSRRAPRSGCRARTGVLLGQNQGAQPTAQPGRVVRCRPGAVTSHAAQVAILCRRPAGLRNPDRSTRGVRRPLLGRTPSSG